MREDVINRVMSFSKEEWDMINRWIPDDAFQPCDLDRLEQQIRTSNVAGPDSDDPVGLIGRPTINRG